MVGGEDDSEPTWASIGAERHGTAQAPTAKGSGGDAPIQPTPGDAHSPPLRNGSQTFLNQGGREGL